MTLDAINTKYNAIFAGIEQSLDIAYHRFGVAIACEESEEKQRWLTCIDNYNKMKIEITAERDGLISKI